MASTTRTITVGGIPYIQVVEYKKTKEGKVKINVIKSFGKDSMENRMRAEQFSASYNKLNEMSEKHKDDSKSLLGPALAIFGIILGVAIVTAIVKKGSEDE